MKKLLLILLCLPLLTLAQQQTYVPDNWFESYLENNGMGNGILNDSSVFTSAIDTVSILDVSMYAGSAVGIFDLTGIEDFTSLTILLCHYNLLTSLDVSQNTELTILLCNYNLLTSLNVSQNTALTILVCDDNQLTSLDVSNNTSLTKLVCEDNFLTSIDVSNNTYLDTLSCRYNQLTYLDVSQNGNLSLLSCESNYLTNLDVSQNTSLQSLYCEDNYLLNSLDVRNGNNTNFVVFRVNQNQNLTCIDVDDTIWANNNWTVANWNIDPHHYFSINCSGTTSIEEHTTNKELFKVTDILGRETNGKKKQPLFYIYDDGTVEKRIIIE